MATVWELSKLTPAEQRQLRSAWCRPTELARRGSARAQPRRLRLQLLLTLKAHAKAPLANLPAHAKVASYYVGVGRAGRVRARVGRRRGDNVRRRGHLSDLVELQVLLKVLLLMA